MLNVNTGKGIMFAEFLPTQNPTMTRVTTVIPWLYSVGTLGINKIIGDAAGNGVMTWGDPGDFGIPIIAGWPPGRLFVSDAAGNLITATDGFYTDATDAMVIGLAGSGSLSVPGAGANSEEFGVGAIASGASSVALGSASVASMSSTIAIGRLASAIAARSIAIGDSVTALHADSIVLAPMSSGTTAAGQLVIGGGASPLTNAYMGAGVAQAAPVDFTLNATGAAGTNIHASDMKIAGGRGTGTAAGGDVKLSVALPGGSGSTQNPLSDVMTISGSNGSVNIGGYDIFVDGNETRDETSDSWAFQKYAVVGIPPFPGLSQGDFAALGPTNNLIFDESVPSLSVSKNTGGDFYRFPTTNGSIAAFNGFNADVDFEFKDTSGFAFVIDSGAQRSTFHDIMNGQQQNVIISAGVATISKGFIKLDAQTGTVDDLDSLAKSSGAFSTGDMMLLTTTGDDITVKHGTGNLRLDAASDKFLFNVGDMLKLRFEGANWYQVAPMSVNNAQSALALDQFIFNGDGAGAAGTTTVVNGITVGEEFVSTGDQLFFGWTFPSDLAKTVDATLELSFYMQQTGAGAPEYIAFDVSILVETPTVDMSSTTGVISLDNIAISQTQFENFIVSANISASTFFTTAGRGWHVMVERKTPTLTPEPSINNDPVMHHGRIQYRRAR